MIEDLSSNALLQDFLGSNLGLGTRKATHMLDEPFGMSRNKHLIAHVDHGTPCPIEDFDLRLSVDSQLTAMEVLEAARTFYRGRPDVSQVNNCYVGLQCIFTDRRRAIVTATRIGNEMCVSVVPYSKG